MTRRFQPTTVGNMAVDPNGGYVSYEDYKELAQLVRECRKALDELLEKRPMQAAMLCGSTTLGNLRVDLNGAVNRMTPNAELSGPRPLAAEWSRLNDVLERVTPRQQENDDGEQA